MALMPHTAGRASSAHRIIPSWLSSSGRRRLRPLRAQKSPKGNGNTLKTNPTEESRCESGENGSPRFGRQTSGRESGSTPTPPPSRRCVPTTPRFSTSAAPPPASISLSA
ncbi:hypothetical protein ACS0TY_000202 [Phlomoides rotata]